MRFLSVFLGMFQRAPSNLLVADRTLDKLFNEIHSLGTLRDCLYCSIWAQHFQFVFSGEYEQEKVREVARAMELLHRGCRP